MKSQTNNKTFSITLTNYAQQCHALHLTGKYEAKTLTSSQTAKQK